MRSFCLGSSSSSVLTTAPVFPPALPFPPHLGITYISPEFPRENVIGSVHYRAQPTHGLPFGQVVSIKSIVCLMAQSCGTCGFGVTNNLVLIPGLGQGIPVAIDFSKKKCYVNMCSHICMCTVCTVPVEASRGTGYPETGVTEGY